MHRGGFILPHVVCPCDDIPEMSVRLEAASEMFRKLCPTGASVEKVFGMRGKGIFKCAWTVRYVRLEGFDEIGRQELIRQILIAKPNNTSIVNRLRLSFPPALELTYSVICTCSRSPNAGLVGL